MQLLALKFKTCSLLVDCNLENPVTTYVCDNDLTWRLKSKDSQVQQNKQICKVLLRPHHLLLSFP